MNLAQKSLVISSGRFANSMARLLVNITIAHLLADQLGLNGQYQKIWLVFNTFYMFFLFGIPESLYFFVPRAKKQDIPAIINQTYYLLIGLGLLFLLFLTGFSRLTANYYHVPNLPAYFRWFAFYGAFMVSSSFVDSLFIVLDRHRLMAYLQVAEAILFYAAAIIPIFLLGDIYLAIVCITLLSALRLIAAHLLINRYLPAFKLRRPQLNWGAIRPQLLFALPIALTNMVGFMAAYLDKNIIAFFIDSNAIYTVYAYGAMELPFIGVFFGSINSVLLPDISRLHHQGKIPEIVLLLRKAVGRIIFVVLPLFLFLLLAARDAYTLVYGEAFGDSSLPFRLYLLLLPIRILFYGRILAALGKASTVTKIALADLIANLLLSIFLVQQIGWLGPAIASVLTTWLEVSAFIWYLGRVLGQKPLAIFPVRGIARAAFLSLLAGIPAVVLFLALPTPLERLLASGSAFALVYLVGIALTGDLRRLRDSLLGGEKSSEVEGDTA
ncbi:MAG: polysaccharide biosynthesis protein [Candidatus Delongbacteria bacterium]|nr:polysaccharide biosynthesis protein [Candidatus Delongbacteria bacterium]